MSKGIVHMCTRRPAKPKPKVEPVEEGSTEFWEEYKKERQHKREANRASSPEMLTKADIRFQSRNGGAHLIIAHGDTFIDFWPGTGLWIPRDTKRKSRGVKKLISYVKGATS